MTCPIAHTNRPHADHRPRRPVLAELTTDGRHTTYHGRALNRSMRSTGGIRNPDRATGVITVNDSYLLDYPATPEGEGPVQFRHMVH
ncbi:hypothetical protein [Streptomyces sp. NPDC018045]|uniref:hypothetical protein n=1 Tax=Streptomyces sp. NPDC018045 TaxID=3365037 RepID=UPI0037B68414